MIVSGLLSCSMLSRALARHTPLRVMFAETLAGPPSRPLAEEVADMKGFLLAAIVSLVWVMPAAGAEEKAGPAASRADVISTAKAPRSIGPFSQGIRAGGLIFCSGQGAFDPATGQLVEGGIKEQTRQVLRNIRAVVEGGGSSMDRVVKVTVFLSDWKYFKEMNEAYAEFFNTERPPARSTVQGARWPEGHLVAMEAIALAE